MKKQDLEVSTRRLVLAARGNGQKDGTGIKVLAAFGRKVKALTIG